MHEAPSWEVLLPTSSCLPPHGPRIACLQAPKPVPDDSVFHLRRRRHCPRPARGCGAHVPALRLLESRVCRLWCPGHVAALWECLGIVAAPVDSGVFEESLLNRGHFCSEQALGMPKGLACRDDLLSMASHMEIGTRQMTAVSENLPALWYGCDLVVNCLDPYPGRRCLRRLPASEAFPLRTALRSATRALLSGQTRGMLRLACHPYSQTTSLPRVSVPWPRQWSGTVCLIVNALGRLQQTNSPLVHLDCDVPGIEHCKQGHVLVP